MSAKIQKWGNSLGVRIPKTIIDKMNLGENSAVDVEYKNGNIIISAAQKKFSIDDLVEAITPKNLHQEQNIKFEGEEHW
jgi:antitoxin MazE